MAFTVLCYAFLLAFAFGWGFWIGASNRGGAIAAVVIGAIGGALIGYPMHESHPLYLSMFTASIVGSFVIWILPEANSAKRWLVKNNGLKITFNRKDR
ncbi:MAG TPA: hypothetical protein V6C81_11725 [Planktothrix sp.]|jgi:ABC-type branched-subunit amino acid transport system permease subunit